MDTHKILGWSAIILFGITLTYHLSVGLLIEAFNLCYLSLLLLGIGLVANHRLLFGIGGYLAVFPFFTVILLVIGSLSFYPRPLSFWLVLGIITHIFAVFVNFWGFRKKFRYFHRHTWWITIIFLVSTWFLTRILNNTEKNTNYSLNPPMFLGFLGLLGFCIITLVSVSCFWLYLNFRYSETNMRHLNEIKPKL